MRTTIALVTAAAVLIPAGGATAEKLIGGGQVKDRSLTAKDIVLTRQLAPGKHLVQANVTLEDTGAKKTPSCYLDGNDRTEDQGDVTLDAGEKAQVSLLGAFDLPWGGTVKVRCESGGSAQAANVTFSDLEVGEAQAQYPALQE